jgi:protein phosphatase
MSSERRALNPCAPEHGDTAPVLPLAFSVVPGPWAATERAPSTIGTHLALQGAVCTHVGCVREHNEDAWLAAPEVGLFAVADGMGGHAAGEVAAAHAIDALADLGGRLTAIAQRAESLTQVIESANRRIFEGGNTDPRCHRMGTTMAAMWLAGTHAVLAHVGDSRIYRLRDGELSLLTLDHSPIGDSVRSGYINVDDARHWPATPVITRHLGAAEGVRVELGLVPVAAGDRFVLCSDGLSDTVPFRQIQRIVRQATDATTAARELVLAALDAGGTDNVTTLVLTVG